MKQVRRLDTHSCGISDIRDFLRGFVMQNCVLNIAKRDGQYKITTACFREWHIAKYGIEPKPRCVRALAMYLPIIAQEQRLKLVKQGTKYILTKTQNTNQQEAIQPKHAKAN
ncbi:MAG: hypothetical protein RXP99_04305 [Vulcanisaeta sp.]